MHSSRGKSRSIRHTVRIAINTMRRSGEAQLREWRGPYFIKALLFFRKERSRLNLRDIKWPAPVSTVKSLKKGPLAKFN